MQIKLNKIKNFLGGKIKQDSMFFLGILVVIFAIIIISVVTLYGRDTHSSVVMSKKTVDDLVEKAANQKYIQKVFNAPDGIKKLPIPKVSETFKLVPDSMRDNNSKEVVAQRCAYKGQTYVVGDIMKTDGGWIRCTPTIVFTEAEDKGKGIITIRQPGSPVWTAIQ